MSLSRDVLKWLQSLDLTFPVKNAKRDFSNGYTIAEIFASYFPQDIQMHSFDNATSVAKKNDNWEQLEKFFRKKNILIDHQIIVDTIHCKGNAAVSMIEEVYTLLTNKKPVKRAVVAEDVAPLPTFARPTASQLIKDNISTAEITGKETKVIASKAQTILEKQKEVQKQERLNEIAREKARARVQPPPPGGLPPSINSLQLPPSGSPRFQPLHPLPYPPNNSLQANPLSNLLRNDRDPNSYRSSRASTPIEKQKALKSAIARKGPMPVTNDMDLPEIEFKQIQVKTIPNDIAEKLRAKSAAPSSPTRVNSPFLHTNGNKSAEIDGKSHSMLPIVSEVVENKLANSDLLYSFDPKAELGLSFFESLSRLPAEVISAVFVDLENQTTKFCRSFFDNPKEMLYFFTLVTPIFTVSSSAHCKEAVIRTLHAIGDKMTSYDASTTWLLFERNVFPFLVNFVARDPHLHRPLASVIFSFCPDDVDSHTNAINKLRELAESPATFIFCLLNLIQSENSGGIMSTYKSEAIKALRNPDLSQVVHAAAVAILAEIIPFEYQLVLPEMDFIAEFAENAIWWEVKAQALYVCCELLKYAVATDDDVHVAQCDFIGRVIASGENIVLRILGGMALAPYLHAHNALYPLYVELLLSLSPPLLRALILDESAGQNLIKGYGDSVGNYKTHFIPSEWNASEFLSFLVQELKATETNRMDEQHVLLCLAACKAIPENIEASEPLELSAWTQIFSDLKEYLCLAFCNVQTCELAEEVLLSFMLSMKQHALQVFPVLHGTILMLFPNISTSFGTPTASKCQDTMIHFLLALHSNSVPAHPYFVSALENLVRNFPEHLVQTRMDVVIDKIGMRD